jgi:hypothetical protein
LQTIFNNRDHSGVRSNIDDRTSNVESLHTAGRFEDQRMAFDASALQLSSRGDSLQRELNQFFC